MFLFYFFHLALLSTKQYLGVPEYCPLPVVSCVRLNRIICIIACVDLEITQLEVYGLTCSHEDIYLLGTEPSI